MRTKTVGKGKRIRNWRTLLANPCESGIESVPNSEWPFGLMIVLPSKNRTITSTTGKKGVMNSKAKECDLFHTWAELFHSGMYHL